MHRFLVLFVIASMFAYGITYASQKRLLGDLDGNGKVDLDDFFMFSSNFGRTGGEIFDPEHIRVDTLIVNHIIRDTLVVNNVVRDTLVVRDTTVIVSDPIIETVYEDLPKLLPSITIEPGAWRQSVRVVQGVCEQVQEVLTEPLVYALDSDILVRHSSNGTRILYSRTSTGSHMILLDTAGLQVLQNIHLFAHEYGHIMTNYYQTPTIRNRWLDESLSSMASLYTFRKLHDKINAGHQITVSIPNMMNRILDFIEYVIPGYRMGPEQFKRWFKVQHVGLKKDPYYQRSHHMIAHNLIDIFEDNPEAWNTVRYLNVHGPISSGHDQDLQTYLRGWYLRTPSIWQKYVVEVAGRFGQLPASKPALAGTDGVP